MSGSRRAPPSFRSIAPPDAVEEACEAEEEARLNALARRRGVARLETETNASTEMAAAKQQRLSAPKPSEPVPEKPHRASSTSRSVRSKPEIFVEPQRALNIELPVSVIRRLKALAVEEDCSVRHLIMRALFRDGIEIPAEAMVPDGRRRSR